MSTPPEQQPQGSTDTSSASMVRVCDRCGTVCSTDQEWCLNCGVRMTEAGQGLPGLRAAGLVVALAVLLAGGAAAASYAALRGDARSAANVPGETTPAPVAQAPPAATPAPVAPATSTPTPAPAPTPTTSKKATPAPAPATPAPAAPATPAAPSTGSGSGTGSTGGSGSGSGGGTGSGGGSGSGSGNGSGGGGGSDSGSGNGGSTPSGPLVFASGQGTIYDPDNLVADSGDQNNAIDGSSSTAWKIKLRDGSATSGVGFVLDFDDPTTVKKLTISTPTSGLKIKVLGTTRSALPPDVNDNRWDTISTEKTLKSGSNPVTLNAVSGGSAAKYRKVLVLFTSIPGTPPALSIREFKASR